MVGGNESLVSFVGDMIIKIQLESGVDHDRAKQQRDDCIVKLLSAYGGQRLYIQSMQKVYKAKIIDGWKRGRTISQLAIDFDKTERQIYNIVAGG